VTIYERMTTLRLYLDANASDVVRPEAVAAAMEAMALTGNPSSVHQEGRLVRRVLERAREGIAGLLGADPEGVVFTSGATEADALAIHALGEGRRVLAGATEHDAVLKARRDVVSVPVLVDGTLDLAALEAELRVGPALVCAMAANSETGVLHPLGEIAALCRAYGALLHVDAVQAAGRVPLDIAALGADSVAISGHKFGGIKGAGALILGGARGRSGGIAGMIAGGGQERGRRGGTPSLPAIAAMEAALAAACAQDWSGIRALRDEIERECFVVGREGVRLDNTACLVLPGGGAQVQVMTLDLAGIAVSAGSACSSGKVAASHVLQAMGLGEAAGQAIRVSLPWNAPADSAERFVVAYRAMAERLGRRVA